MSALDNLRKRMEFTGGLKTEERIIADKRKSLKKALTTGYQDATIEIHGKVFKALINRDKLKPDYDNQIISILYEDIQLNNDKIGKTIDGLMPTEIKIGDVFLWRETNTYWIIYLQYQNELAYFRAEIRECKKEVEINGHKYKVYYRGPVETTVPWNQKLGFNWNTMNYSSIIYITKNEETLDYFHRFAKIKIDNKPWEVKVVNESSGDGIIEIVLSEDYSNTLFEEAQKYDNVSKEENKEKLNEPYIEGDLEVYPFDKKIYKIKNVEIENGKWEIDNIKKAQILSQNQKEVNVEIIAGRSGQFNLIYNNGKDIISQLIVIKPI